VIRFDIPADTPLIDGREQSDVFAFDHAAIILGMHGLAVYGAFHASAAGLLAFGIAHVLFGLGIPIGFHRLLAHKAFRCAPWVLYILATLGTLAFQGGPLLWAATHRTHHKQTDAPGDAHSSARGFWWSHMGWTFYRRPNGFFYGRSRRLIADLLEHSYLRVLDRYAVLINIGAALLCLGITRNTSIVLWAFPVRIVFDWHLTWLINSYAHFAPFRLPKGTMEIRNSILLGYFAFGEGWHKNHHEYPGRANFGVGPRQFDPSYGILRGMQAIGLVEIRRDHPTNTPSNDLGGVSP
jgi:stearoyl-CoA desaturase (delta-9 desaturase)